MNGALEITCGTRHWRRCSNRRVVERRADNAAPAPCGNIRRSAITPIWKSRQLGRWRLSRVGLAVELVADRLSDGVFLVSTLSAWPCFASASLLRTCADYAGGLFAAVAITEMRAFRPTSTKARVRKPRPHMHTRNCRRAKAAADRMTVNFGTLLWRRSAVTICAILGDAWPIRILPPTTWKPVNLDAGNTSGMPRCEQRFDEHARLSAARFGERHAVVWQVMPTG